MTDTERKCQICGTPLEGLDKDKLSCHPCRSPEGKIADLDIAIRASGDDPSRIDGWSEVRFWLEKRFAPTNHEVPVELLWRRFKDWARFVKKIPTAHEFLDTPLTQLVAWLEHEFDCAEHSVAGTPDRQHLEPEIEPTSQQASDSMSLASEELRKSIPLPQAMAFLAFEYAEDEWDKELFINEAWELLREHGIENDERLKDYKLPSKKTFADYVSKARGKLGKNRYQRRAGRNGRSIAHPSEL